MLSGNIADSAQGTSSAPGTLTINPNNAGDSVLLSGNNTYTGTTSLGGNAAGIVAITNASAFGASTVGLDRTQIQASTNLVLNNNFINQSANPSILSGTSSLTIAGSFTNSGVNGGFSNNSTGPLTLAGNISLMATNTLTLGGSGETVLSGSVANFNATTGTVGQLAYNGAGGGVLYITNTGNSYTGVTDISAGTVNVASLSNYGVNGSLGMRLAAF